MKIQYMSDLHLEADDFNLVESSADVLILAGDIAQVTDSIQLYKFLEKCTDAFEHVIYVTGNHEYYCGDMGDVNVYITGHLQDTFPNFYFLNDSYFDIDNVRFIGGTLWTDFDNNPLYELEVQRSLNDYRYISYGGEVLTPAITKYLHENTKRFIGENLSTGDNIVVTHHAPSWQSSSPRFEKDTLTSGFASHMDQFIAYNNIKLWFHGHMHNNSDYMIGETRVLCNPKGYRQENGFGFGRQKTIDI